LLINTVPESENGNMTMMSDASGKTVYHYDLLGRIKKEVKTVLGITYITAYEYDKVGNMKSITYPSGRVVVVGYNPVNRPNLVSAIMNRPETVASGFVYDPAGRLTSLTLGNGISESWAYDAANQVKSISVPGILGLTYAHDTAGNIISIVDALSASSSRTYAYDPLDRLVNATGPWGSLAWTYDSNGNRYASRQRECFTYDANRLTSVTGRSAPTSTTTPVTPLLMEMSSSTTRTRG
jgi:YD repeat-containing protein